MTKHYDICDAPICRMDTSSLASSIAGWYPDEPICNARPMAQWQRTQVKIARRYKAGTLKHTDGLFTATMLNSIARVADGIAGWPPRLGTPPLTAVTVGSGFKVAV